MRGILIAACLLGACAVLAAGCEDKYNPKDKECGYAENGCWDDGTCNTGYECNTSRKGEPLGEGKCPSNVGVCEEAPDGGVTPTLDGTTPTPDGPPPTPDGPTPDGPAPGEPTTDGPVPDAAPSAG